MALKLVQMDFQKQRCVFLKKQDSDARQFWQANRACTAFA